MRQRRARAPVFPARPAAEVGLVDAEHDKLPDPSWRTSLPAFAPPSPDAIPIWFVSGENWQGIKASIGDAAAAFAESCRFEPKAGALQLAPDARGRLAGALFGVEEEASIKRDPFAAGRLATALPAGVYHFANPPADADLAALAFLLGGYRYSRFKSDEKPEPRLIAPAGIAALRIERIAGAVAFGRDLINAPANLLGPSALEQETVKLAEGLGAAVSMVRGGDLLAANLPLIHGVGRASAERPRIVDFAWGRADAPKVTLVGKGVTFDTGGLDIKPAAGMELMKKDMGGAGGARARPAAVLYRRRGARGGDRGPRGESPRSRLADRKGDVKGK